MALPGLNILKQLFNLFIDILIRIVKFNENFIRSDLLIEMT